MVCLNEKTKFYYKYNFKVGIKYLQNLADVNLINKVTFCLYVWLKIQSYCLTIRITFILSFFKFYSHLDSYRCTHIYETYIATVVIYSRHHEILVPSVSVIS